MSRIDGLRRENGINLVVKVPFKEGLLLCREILPPPDGDVFFSKLWRKLVFQWFCALASIPSTRRRISASCFTGGRPSAEVDAAPILY